MDGQPERPRRKPEDAIGTPLEGLLEEMRELRLTLAADLAVAAGAAEAGADNVAADIVEADRLELARFARVADQRLRGLDIEDDRLTPSRPDAERRPAWRRRVAVALPVVPVASALALSAAAATGALPIPGSTSRHAQPPAAVAAASPEAGSGVASTFQELANVIQSDPRSAKVLAVASKLHQQIARLIANSPHNPRGAAEVAQLLHMEQALLIRAQPAGVDAMLKETRQLAARLITVAPELVSPTTRPTIIPTLAPSHKPSHSASPKPTATPKRNSPKPSTTPAPAKSAPPSDQPTPPWPTFPN